MLQKDTCFSIPSVKAPEDLERVTISEGTKWLQYMKKGNDYLRSHQDGSFVLLMRVTVAPMDYANALRDDELFMDFILQPDFVHCLIKSP
ncbi:MAG: hypothetical protein ONB31_14970 [candidate division KSB1 bacterium]|nr:hypothetical protein [candidate division KSB1 bacterium]